MSIDEFRVADQVVAITGGTGVLGGALGVGLAKAGAKVAIMGRSEEKGRAVVDAIRQAGGVAEFFAVDVTSLDSCRSAAAQVSETWSGVDALINAAGGNSSAATATPDQSFFELDADALQFVMQLNAMGTVLPCQVFGQQIAQRQRGAIVNISSMAALRPLTRVVGYSAAKAAVTNFTQWLSVYMCQHVGPEVRVNAVAPGFFLTEQNRFLLTQPESGELTDRGQQIVAHTPMGRFGEPDELVGTVQWLLSPASRFVTGVVVPVDGGFSAYSGV